MAAQPQHDSPASSDHSSAASEAVTFLVVHCPQCAREVLTARDLDADGQLVDVCLHCAARLDRQAPSARWLDADALSQRGYFVDGSEAKASRHGTRGCRGGSCGVQQPDQ